VRGLHDRLDLKRCIWNADLSEGTAARNNVLQLLETQRKVDEEKKVLTELYHRGVAVVRGRPTGSGEPTGGVVEYDGLSKDRLNNKKLTENLQNEIKAVEAKINTNDQGVIEELKKARDAYRSDKSRKEADRQEVEISRRPCETIVAELELKWEQIKAANQKQRTFNNRILVSQDLGNVVKNTLDELQTVY